MGKKLSRDDRIYQEQFGHIPNEQMARIELILGKQINNEKYNQKIADTAKRIKRIKWKKVSFTLWKIVKPSARPRANTQRGYIHMYVPGAKEAGDWFEEFAKENKLPSIETPCILNMKIYEKTPTSFSIKDKVLAEMGFLRPWKRTGDFDNYAKGVADAIQHGMLKDDCLVIDSRQQLYYSIKPHADIEVLYMAKFPNTKE